MPEPNMGQKMGNQLPTGEPSFASLVQEYWPVIFRMLVRLTGQTHDAEDLAQETFLRAMKRLDSFQPGTNLRAWLLRIASNAFLDLKRKHQRVGIQPLSLDPETTSEMVGYALEVAEESDLARIALEELPELTRLIFHLRVQEELAFCDIGEIVGLTENAARQQMYQARTKLLKRLER